MRYPQTSVENRYLQYLEHQFLKQNQKETSMRKIKMMEIGRDIRS